MQFPLVLVLFLGIYSACAELLTSLYKTALNPLQPIFDVVDSKNAAFLKILSSERLKLDTKLEQMFPLFKDQIRALHDVNNACYDQTVGVNKTIDIFQGTVHTIIKDFIVSFHKVF